MGHDPRSRAAIAHAIALAVVLTLSCVPAALAKDSDQIEPGPAMISAEEMAIVADPGKGVEHAVILVEETSRNENLGPAMQTSFHMRAKILSNEGRDLANIEIPVVRRESKLKKFWGRTILPDGTVLELSKSDLDRQVVASSKREGNVEMVKAALPGVVPGCVIDYGYVLLEQGYYPYDRVPLQRAFPIRWFEFHWRPYAYMQAGYRLSRTDLLDVEVAVDGGGVRVTGRNLPPVIDEPLMPPDHEVRGALVVYYVPDYVRFDRFWNDVAAYVEKVVAKTTKKKRSVQRALTEMGLTAEGDQREELRRAYGWIGDNLTRTGLRTFEELQAVSDEDDESKDLIAGVLENREGSSLDLQLLFIAVARALGAEAYLVFAPDRRYNYWHEDLKSLNQFDATLVAARPAGVEQFTALDPGSGLRFGELPWWLAGQQGLLLARKDARAILLPATAAKHNVAESTVILAFAEGNESMIANWVRRGTGQVGLDERRYLRSLPPDDRQERVDELCGAGPDTEILEAKVLGLDEITHGLQLHCETEDFDVGPLDEIGEYRLHIAGPWLRGLPDLPEGRRHHPVVFEFPRVEVVNLEVTAPEGFVPDDPPSPAKVESSLGKYVLRVSRVADRFMVEREFSLHAVAVPAEQYDELREFIAEVERLDRVPLTFRRAEAAR